MLTRRDFIKTIGMVGAIVLTPMNKLLSKLPYSLFVDVPNGELYEGFLLLEKDDPIPAFVEAAPCPILDHVEALEEYSSTVMAFRGIATWFDDIESVKSNINFPIFILGQLPNRMKFLTGYVLRFAGSGEIWEVRIDYGFEDTKEPDISLSARPIYTKPFPVWPLLVEPKKENDLLILDEEFIVVGPQKVAFTPRPGIMLPTYEGFMMQWIENDILYTIFMEYEEWRGAANVLSKLLVKI